MSAPHVQAISLKRREAWLSSDVVVPITNLFDCAGDATDDLGEASVFVCGSDETKWFTGHVSDFVDRTQ